MKISEVKNMILNKVLLNEYKEVHKVNKGWSKDEKFYIESENGEKFLLRISPIEYLDRKEKEFNLHWRYIAYTHQEANALYFLEHKAIRALFRNEQNTEKLLEEIRKLIQNPELRKELGENIKKMKVFASAQKILDEYKDILGL